MEEKTRSNRLFFLYLSVCEDSNFKNLFCNIYVGCLKYLLVYLECLNILWLITLLQLLVIWLCWPLLTWICDCLNCVALQNFICSNCLICVVWQNYTFVLELWLFWVKPYVCDVLWLLVGLNYNNKGEFSFKHWARIAKFRGSFCRIFKKGEKYWGTFMLKLGFANRQKGEIVVQNNDQLLFVDLQNNCF